MLGLKRGAVQLYDHEKAWEYEAAEVIGRLRVLLGDAADDIQHIGSTSIPSIKAKPIIDIAVAAPDFEKILALAPILRENGFYYRPGNTTENGLLFACGKGYDGEGSIIQSHFIHVVKSGSMEWINYINFRDYLIKTPSTAQEYERLKLSLAAAAPTDSGREQYTKGKHEFITYTLRKAIVNSYLGKTAHIKIDRPIGYVHRKEKYTLTYPINYGYIPGVLGGDGEEMDVYLLGADGPVEEYTATIIGIIHRHNDVEDKLVAAPEGIRFSKAEISAAVHFQEQYYDTEIETI